MTDDYPRNDAWYFKSVNNNNTDDEDRGVGDSMYDYGDKEGDAKWPNNWTDSNETATQWNKRMADKAAALDSIRGKPKPLEEVLTLPSSALGRQAGGEHYKDLAIQPVEYCVRNGLGMCESNVIKYVTRHAVKGGQEDIKKAIHMLELLLELKY